MNSFQISNQILNDCFKQFEFDNEVYEEKKLFGDFKIKSKKKNLEEINNDIKEKKNSIHINENENKIDIINGIKNNDKFDNYQKEYINDYKIDNKNDNKLDDKVFNKVDNKFDNNFDVNNKIDNRINYKKNDNNDNKNR